MLDLQAGYLRFKPTSTCSDSGSGWWYESNAVFHPCVTISSSGEIFSVFLPKIEFGISCKLTPMDRICMSPIFWEKNKENISKCHLLEFLSSMVSIPISHNSFQIFQHNFPGSHIWSSAERWPREASTPLCMTELLSCCEQHCSSSLNVLSLLAINKISSPSLHVVYKKIIGSLDATFWWVKQMPGQVFLEVPYCSSSGDCDCLVQIFNATRHPRHIEVAATITYMYLYSLAFMDHTWCCCLSPSAALSTLYSIQGTSSMS